MWTPARSGVTPRIPDRVVFEYVIAALVHGSGDERIAEPLIREAIRALGRDTDMWFDTHWILDSTPLPFASPMLQGVVRRDRHGG